jgi:predicted ATPase/class 3 adenylate cyclase
VAALPTGTVTFLFTDLEGSTRLWEEHREEMGMALARHEGIVREAVESHSGQVVKTTGDGGYSVFRTAHDAVGAALDAQRALTAAAWGLTPFRVRMGIHTGEAELRDGDYFGTVLNRAARLMSAGHGGQVLVSQVTAELARDSVPVGVGLRDLGEHRLRDLSRAERIFQAVGPGCAAEFPPLRTLNAFPGNLPVQVTSFVGRSGELARVRQELAEGRLVTLTGVGGVGKTRLALEVAAEVVPEYRDGAWLVELAGVRDPDLVPEAVVEGFGLQPRAEASTTETLLEFLGRKALLLVLDNCEHLLGPVGTLVGQVLRVCPAVRFLATSREALNVAGEHILGVASLAVPHDRAPVGEIAQCEAVVLFVERGRAVKASFALDASNAVAVGQVCRRLDGIPLAIELAAARVGILTPVELSRRLDRRFRLLAGGQRSAVERHQTLRAAIDWSYEMLAGSEQLLLARLSVFVGGFSLEAAEVVTADGALDAGAVFDLLASLVSRSLVMADTQDVETGYWLLETIRQYAQERLEERGELDRLRSQHAAYYSHFGEIAIVNTTASDGAEWERRVKRESDNFRAALAWAIDAQDADSAVRLLGMWDAPTQYVVDDGTVASMVQWAADAVLALPGAAERPKYPAALVVAAYCAWARGDPKLALQYCDDADAAAQRLGTEPSVLLLGMRSVIARTQGRAGEAVEHGKHAVEMARLRDRPAWLIRALQYSVLARTMNGDQAGAVAEAKEILALQHRLPNTRTVQTALVIAAFALSDSEPDQALTLTRQVVARLGRDESMGWGIAGDIAARNGERLEALAYFDRAIEAHYWLGSREPIGPPLARVGALLADDDPDAAAVLFGAADTMAPAFAHSHHHIAAREQAMSTLERLIGTPRSAELHARGEGLTEYDAAQFAHAAISRALGEHRPQ